MLQPAVNDQEREEKDREHELESLKAKVTDLMNRLNPGHITQNAVDLKLESPEVQALQVREDDLRKQFDKLSSTIISSEVAEAKIKRFDRLREDALADGEVEKAKSILQEKNEFLDGQKKIIEATRGVNSQIEQVESQLKGLFVPIFIAALNEIKTAFGSKLLLAVKWTEKEFEEFLELQESFGIKLFVNPENEMRLYRENPWKETRDKLDRWLP